MVFADHAQSGDVLNWPVNPTNSWINLTLERLVAKPYYKLVRLKSTLTAITNHNVYN
ncbi:hypothetical protein SAMN05216167_11231 [Spirosoma endophyticum]|uniref:Uncharacterized protein n=1 Tax=Spirosoma endophyticum TaxID=662367 RepID=A0A1I1ZA31_9BACT|nr:hypothetical protein SAMN05216167_11231 [Spirosoma endophyticum]